MTIYGPLGVCCCDLDHRLGKKFLGLSQYVGRLDELIFELLAYWLQISMLALLSEISNLSFLLFISKATPSKILEAVTRFPVVLLFY